MPVAEDSVAVAVGKVKDSADETCLLVHSVRQASLGCWLGLGLGLGLALWPPPPPPPPPPPVKMGGSYQEHALV